MEELSYVSVDYNEGGSHMTVFTCEDRIEDMFTCIYVAWEWALVHGHDQLRLEKEPIVQYTLFDQYIHVEPDADKAEKVARSIRQKISYDAYVTLHYACLSKADMLDVMYRYLRIGFRVGNKINQMLTDSVVMQMSEIRRTVGNEIHYWREFLRFHSVDGKVYVSHFEPKNHVITYVATHFADRMPSEHWMIIDDTRGVAAVHPKDGEWYMVTLTNEEQEQLKETEKYRDSFTDMWKVFFDTIGIQKRKNEKCQRNMFPIWMRKHATEFQV